MNEPEILIEVLVPDMAESMSMEEFMACLAPGDALWYYWPEVCPVPFRVESEVWH